MRDNALLYHDIFLENFFLNILFDNQVFDPDELHLICQTIKNLEKLIKNNRGFKRLSFLLTVIIRFILITHKRTKKNNKLIIKIFNKLDWIDPASFSGDGKLFPNAFGF